jgi:hypothetical protein
MLNPRFLVTPGQGSPRYGAVHGGIEALTAASLIVYIASAAAVQSRTIGTASFR